MQVVQYTGPFSKGDQISTEVKYDYTFVHIGVQIPQKWPIAYWKEEAYDPDISINGTSYAVNANGILEFDGTTETEFTLRFVKDLPPETIVDVAYETSEE